MEETLTKGVVRDTRDADFCVIEGGNMKFSAIDITKLSVWDKYDDWITLEEAALIMGYGRTKKYQLKNSLPIRKGSKYDYVFKQHLLEYMISLTKFVA